MPRQQGAFQAMYAAECANGCHRGIQPGDTIVRWKREYAHTPVCPGTPPPGTERGTCPKCHTQRAPNGACCE